MGETQARREIVLEGPLYVEVQGTLRSQELFGDERPLLVDIGAARARFFRNIAHELPGVGLLGIELRKKRVEEGLERLAKDGITNARLIWGDAVQILRDHVAPDSLAAITVLFPDPWPKKRHAKRRIFEQAEIVALFASRLRRGGVYLFKTDSEDYFGPVLAACEGETRLERVERPLVAPQGAEPFSLDLPKETYYEQKWRAMGRRFFEASFRRR